MLATFYYVQKKLDQLFVHDIFSSRSNGSSFVTLEARISSFLVVPVDKSLELLTMISPRLMSFALICIYCKLYMEE